MWFRKYHVRFTSLLKPLHFLAKFIIILESGWRILHIAYATDWTIRVRIPVQARDFSRCGVYPASYSLGTGVLTQG
jgi:hypothetical protein